MPKRRETLTSKKSSSVNIAIVERLKQYQKNMKGFLKGKGLSCNLQPKSSSKACSICPYYAECKSHKIERDYIMQGKETVDFVIVEELKQYQKDVNYRLKGTGVRCNLHPKPDLEPCKSCPNYDKCKSHQIERDYILNNRKYCKVLRRRRKRKYDTKVKDSLYFLTDERKSSSS